MKSFDGFKVNLLVLGLVAAILVCGDGNTNGAYGSTFPASSSYVPCLPGSGGDLKTDAEAPLLVTIDTSQTRQTIYGFGASDAWSIQFVGQWPDQKRQAIADLLFETELDEFADPKGIGLSAWRFNIGAGSSRQSNISDTWRRADTFFNESFTAYDWSHCSGQRWFLQAAKARGLERFIAFVNSPPVNMTKNGLAYCWPNSGDTNLREDKIEHFATYLATILQHFRDMEGIEFAGISPFNEPNWDWDNAGQEGCRYYNSDIKQVVLALHQELQNRQINTQIEIPEAGDIGYLYGYPINRGNYIDAFFHPDSPYYVGDKVAYKISAHSYFFCWPEDNRLVGGRQRLRAKLDLYPGLGYAMSEYCILIPSGSWVPSKYWGYGNGRDLGIDPALWIARVIHCDLTIAEACSWDWWLAVSPYSYKDGLVYVDKRAFDGGYYESKMLWAVGNFSRFIRPEMTRVAVYRSDNATDHQTVEDLMVSAYYKNDDDIVVIVFVNWAYEDKPVELDFLGVGVDCLIPYVTKGNSDSKDNLTAYNALGPDDTVVIPARSIVTLIGMPTNFGDYNKDGNVDFQDFAILAAQWLETSAGEFSSDPIDKRQVDFTDLAVLADYWLTGVRLAAYWRLDERAGNVAHDSAGNKDGTLYGEPVWQPTAGKVAGALELDGVDDYVTTPSVSNPAHRPFSIFAWVKGGAPGQVVVSQIEGANWLVADGSDGRLMTSIKGPGRFAGSLISQTLVTDGDWHHIGLVWDGSYRILYVDDAEVGKDAWALQSLWGSDGGLYIGADKDMNGGSFWSGLIDDVRIYHRAVKP